MERHYTQLDELLSVLGIRSADMIKSHYTKNSLQRGFDYYLQNSVLEMRPEEMSSQDAISIEGKVRGSYSDSYNVAVHISYRDERILVRSNCSCPVGRNCKHSVAVILTLAEGVSELDKQQIDSAFDADEVELNDWLQNVAPDAQTSPSQVPSNSSQDLQYAVVYVLTDQAPRYSYDENEGNLGSIFLTMSKARRLKKGGYGQVYRLNSWDLLGHYTGSSIYSEQADRELIQQLKGLHIRQYEEDTKATLQGDFGYLILKKAISTGRCFWESQKNEPLQWSEEKTVECGWQELDGVFQTQFLQVNPNERIFDLQRFIFIDTLTKRVGEIAPTNMGHEQARKFLQAPQIPASKAADFSERIIESFPDQRYPTPVPTYIEEKFINKVALTPVLQLHPKPAPDGSPRQIHIGSLSFRYGDCEIFPKSKSDLNQALSYLIKDKIRYCIERDLQAESKAIETLQAAGFSTFEHSLACEFVQAANSLETSVLQWEAFLHKRIPELEALGWQISIAEDFNIRVDTADDWYADIEDSDEDGWFSLNLGFNIQGKNFNLLPLLVQLLHQNPDTNQLHETLSNKEHQVFPLSDGQWVKVPTKRILTILDTLIELYDTEALGADGQLEFSRHATMHLRDLLNDESLQWKGADELQQINNKLQAFDGIEAVELPSNLNAQLREYQQHGVDWLQFLREYGFHGVLADDMGLGKTLQILTHLLIEKQQGRSQHPNLVIAPTSLMSNWKNEAARFTPDLSVLVLQGSSRQKQFEHMADFDVVLTTYPLMTRDQAHYKDQQFHCLVLDEAQAIKNAKAKTTQFIYGLKAEHRVCVTGTPMENHLGELWSMFHFLMPGFLGSHDKFTRLFRTPVEKEGDNNRARQLQQRINPFLMRRTKSLVASELPEKTEIIRTVSLSGKQQDLYETVRLAMEAKVQAEVSKKGLARSQIMILDALLKLRQVCCDPQLVKLKKARSVKQSAKMDLLTAMVPEMIEEGRKILLFSQFTQMLAIIEDFLKAQNISYSKLTGQTRKREEAIDKFQSGGADVFLISLKAGGVGLNLTAADTVIHYDPWWNPAAEQQATDRAYRIGQDKPVFVYKLISEDTVEEKILQLQAKKQALADSMYGNKKADKPTFDQTELLDLLKPVQ